MTYRAAAWLTLIIPFTTLCWTSLSALLGFHVEASLTLSALAMTVIMFGCAVLGGRG